jgi:hypothetical protein
VIARVALLSLSLATISLACRPYSSERASITDPSDFALDTSGAPRALHGEVHSCPRSLPDGPVDIAWPSGATALEGECENGKMVGAWRGGYINGARRWRCEFVNGRLEGDFEGFYPNGERRVELSFWSGAANGAFIAYRETGEVAMTGVYVRGRKNGCFREVDDRGREQRKGAYANDVKVGVWLAALPTGERALEDYGAPSVETTRYAKCLLVR